MAIRTEQIEGLPFFMGLSKKDLKEVTSNVTFSLRHHKKGGCITEEGNVCNMLVFLIEGWMEIDTYNDPHTYHLKETVQAPQLLEPEKLFGMNQQYTSTYRAVTPCETIAISKEDVVHLFTQYQIIRMNLLNIICRRTQLLERQPWQTRSRNLKERIAMFVRQHSRYPAGKKQLYIRMTDLSVELNDSRLHVSEALNALAEEDRIILKRGIIEIPALQLL